MKFKIYERGALINFVKDTVYMQRDNWDDYGFKTTFCVFYCFEHMKLKQIGHLKIGVVNMEEGRVVDLLDREFNQLEDRYFSLGQDENYYANVSSLGEEKRKEFLKALQDVVYNLNHFEKMRSENVMKTSLLRTVSPFSVKEQWHRIAHGGAKLTKYKFSYNLSDFNCEEETSNQITFDVVPNSNPPTNIHVLIGRNGTGKTTLIKNLIHSIRHNDSDKSKFDYERIGRLSAHSKFANVLCVAFSPFDDFSEIDNDTSEIPYSYIGLNKQSGDLFKAIEEQFLKSFSNCMINTRKKKLWLNAIKTLKSDPTFDDISIDKVACNILSSEKDQLASEKTKYVKDVFSTLSSGHKVVLLIITCCVDKIEEKSIVFIDEPENHLHPPLLSALIRALSDLLTDRNGVAIISTHSPVVLQEVPSSCVWALRRLEQKLVAERLENQTFGSSIGTLTNEVFKLEITNSGFHKLLSEAVNNSGEFDDYDTIVDDFDNQLGNEATVLLRVLLALRKGEDD